MGGSPTGTSVAAIEIPQEPGHDAVKPFRVNPLSGFRSPEHIPTFPISIRQNYEQIQSRDPGVPGRQSHQSLSLPALSIRAYMHSRS